MIDKMNLNEEPFERIHTDKLKEMGKNAYNSAKKYTKKAVIKTWEQLLDETKEK